MIMDDRFLSASAHKWKEKHLHFLVEMVGMFLVLNHSTPILLRESTL